MAKSDYTQVRIKKIYHAKLSELAKLHTRSMSNMLEILIDKALTGVKK